MYIYGMHGYGYSQAIPASLARIGSRLMYGSNSPDNTIPADISDLVADDGICLRGREAGDSALIRPSPAADFARRQSLHTAYTTREMKRILKAAPVGDLGDRKARVCQHLQSLLRAYPPQIPRGRCVQLVRELVVQRGFRAACRVHRLREAVGLAQVIFHVVLRAADAGVSARRRGMVHHVNKFGEQSQAERVDDLPGACRLARAEEEGG
ncbi:MAG: hypothetical protein A2283_13875 [Lentisphaerae bacterium RIFOXYA12_FULL_48_11]|nr:MAG: hypothetical protein A2283_13875 [Lentisphaerae bacterium RIFOXYA12_FULL_48_11]